MRKKLVTRFKPVVVLESAPTTTPPSKTQAIMVVYAKMRIRDCEYVHQS